MFFECIIIGSFFFGGLILCCVNKNLKYLNRRYSNYPNHESTCSTQQDQYLVSNNVYYFENDIPPPPYSQKDEEYS